MASQTPHSLIERLEKLDRERNEIITAAKDEQLAVARAAVDALAKIGFPYLLVTQDELEGKKARKNGTGTHKVRTLDPNKVCPVCVFATDPPHDKRHHRAQGKKAKPFTAAELEQKGLIKRQ